jgi:hypothetical protein
VAHDESDRELVGDVAASEAASEQLLEVAHWPSALLDWASAIALPFVVGLFLLALATALIGYLLVHLAWTAYEAVQRAYRGR